MNNDTIKKAIEAGADQSDKNMAKIGRKAAEFVRAHRKALALVNEMDQRMAVASRAGPAAMLELLPKLLSVKKEVSEADEALTRLIAYVDALEEP